MSSRDMSIIIGGVTLPLYSSLKELLDPNETDNVTLDGTLYTDFINNRRSWQVGWEKLKAADYDTIRGIYEGQYSAEAYPVVEIPEYGVIAPMKVNISDRNIRLNGEIIEGVTITLKEQYAIS